MSSSSPTPGLAYVTAKIKDSNTLSEDKFNEFYNDEHFPQVLRDGFSKVALRYKNSNPERPAPYLALYPQEDIANISSPATLKMMDNNRKSSTFNGQEHPDLISYTIGTWRTIQTFEGYGHASKSGKDRGQTLVAVAMEPGEGAEEDFHAWYRKQHLDMLAMCRGYRRTVRYRREGEEQPRFLALHEYACEAQDLPAEQIKQVSGTEWSRDVLGKAKMFERDVWGLVGVQGDEELKL